MTNNEKTLCHAALDASVTDVKRLCNEFRWTEDEKNNTENDRALKQWESRTLLWDETSTGSTRIQLVLPPEIAQVFLNSVEHSLAQMDVDDVDQKISQRRADAAIVMAETSLQSASRDIATADRYQVIVSVEASELKTSTGYATSTECGTSTDSGTNTDSGKNTEQTTNAGQATSPQQTTSLNTKLPAKRASVKGASFLARESAKRIACDCTVSTITKDNGEPVDIGRRSRIWPNAMARAIKDRDQHCQFYGCTQTNNLQIHHIIHWADGGTTSVSNGACLCAYHHVMVHEGGYRIQAVANDDQCLNEQFSMQQRKEDITMFSFEKELRNDRDSFDRVRMLAPTRYRFRIVNSDGQDIRMAHSTFTGQSESSAESASSSTPETTSTKETTSTPEATPTTETASAPETTSALDIKISSKTDIHYPITHTDSTRVECGEPVAGYYYGRDKHNRYDESCRYTH